MESSSSPTLAKKILNIFRVVCCMIRKGIISKRKLMMDLHLLLKRGKIAGKAIGNLMTVHHHHPDHSAYASSFSMNPGDVEFSCSNTPSYPPFHLGSHRRKSRKNSAYDCEAAAAVAKAFEMLSSSSDLTSEVDSVAPSIAPSPMLGLFKKSPRTVRQLRITDSPFPVNENEVSDGKVDREAGEFIKRFYEQLRNQLAVATPENKFRRG